jgi:Ni,Fe-hydrogenase I small subunit
MKEKRPKPGQVIEVNWRPVFSTDEGFNAMEATVQDCLATQFTAIVAVDGEPMTYRFYADYGDSWRFIE